MKIKKFLLNKTFWRGVAAIILALCVWQILSSWKFWFGYTLPAIGEIPRPSAVFTRWWIVIFDASYWMSWYASYSRVLIGFFIAICIGIPFGLAIAVNKHLHALFFPIFETLRPIPPLAWIPASLIFWPTQEMSIIFVIFLGAFYAVVLNVVGGAKQIDQHLIRAAQSMGATQWQLFWKVILPATLPSIFTGAAVGMGITWEVVVAAEMIAVGGRVYGGGLGFFVWNSFVGGSTEQAIIGMLSIGIAGYLASSFIRWLGNRLMPWQSEF